MIEFDDPVSRAAIWSRRAAIFAVPLLVIAVFVARSGRVETVPALAAIGAGLLLAALAVILALLAFVVIWVRGERGARRALTGLVIGAALLAYPAFSALMAYRMPDLIDISTDVREPPPLRAALIERRRGENPVEYPGQQAALVQLASYPDIGPITIDLPLTDVQGLALELAGKKGWRVVAGEEAEPEAREAYIEAVSRTMLLGLVSDVVIRLRPLERGTRVDMRAASRFGHSDYGVNAALIRGYLKDLAAIGR